MELKESELKTLREKRTELLRQNTEITHENELLKQGQVAQQLKIEELEKMMNDIIKREANDRIQRRREISFLEMEMEDYRSRAMQFMELKARDDHRAAVLNSELKYLSKKYVAFLILKSWSAARRSAFEQEVQRNKEKIGK